jgi:hypothetical protein
VFGSVDRKETNVDLTLAIEGQEKATFSMSECRTKKCETEQQKQRRSEDEKKRHQLKVELKPRRKKIIPQE